MLLAAAAVTMFGSATVYCGNTDSPPAGYPAQITLRNKAAGSEDITSLLSGHAVSITDIVSVAMSINPAIATAKESLANAEGAKKSVASGEGLSINTSATLGQYDSAQTSNGIVTRKQDTQAYVVSASIPIDITRQLKEATNQARFQRLVSEMNLLSVQNETVLNVKSAFYDVLRAQALLKVAETDMENAKANLRDARLRYEAGTTTRYDVLSTEASVSSSMQSLVSAENSLAISFAKLNNTVGLNIDVSYDLTTEGAVQTPEGIAVDLSDITSTDTAAIPIENTINDIKPGEIIGDNGTERANQLQNFVVKGVENLGVEYDALIKEALEKRPEIMEQEANLEAAKKGIYLARKNIMPGLSVGYNYSYTPTTVDVSGKNVGEVAITLSTPIFDSGYVSGRVKSARAELAVAEINRRRQIDAVILEVRKSYLTLQESIATLRSARVELAKADEGYRVAKLRYATGVTSSSYASPILELNDAQKNLNTAQKNFVNALFDYNNNRCALEKAVGRYAAAFQ